MTSPPDKLPLLGYTDRPSARPGETIELHVSCADPGGYDAELVRLRHGDLASEGPGAKIDLIGSVEGLDGHHRGGVQRTASGSVAVFPENDWLTGDEWSVKIRVCPWGTGLELESILHLDDEAGNGVELFLEDARFGARVFGSEGETRICGQAPFEQRCWHELALTLSGGELTLHTSPVGTPVASRLRFRAAAETVAAPAAAGTGAIGRGELWLAGRPLAEAEAPFAEAHLSGKLEGPRFESGAAGGGPWTVDFSAELSDAAAHERCTATGAAGTVEGTLHNLPMRAVTGSGWAGYDTDFKSVPDQYGAVHFHPGDMSDCRWEVSHRIQLPEDLPSGIYAARLTAATGVDHVPFVVRPAAGSRHAPIAFLLPTISYLAYANDTIGPDAENTQLVSGRVASLHPASMYLHMHRELGASLYDLHPDGSGVSFSSWRRPLMNMRPGLNFWGARVWQFNADLHIIDWLSEKGFEYDVITDHDIHAEGADLLGRYRTVITGTHPEYSSASMLDAFESYVEGGGRMMYMGGNGYYWVTAFDPAGSGTVEVRRYGGTETWTAEPGQGHLQFTGEPGGIWRHRGRAPQRIFGVGFIAQGLDISAPYERLDPAVRGEADAWVFEGVEEDLIGDFGLVGGGASGLEIDSVNQLLGTPPQTEILASSDGRHTALMMEVRENVGTLLPTMGGTQNPNVRADLTVFELDGGGGVFSTGSIAWSGSLSHDNYENSVSRVTENVLRRFSASQQ